MKQPSSPAPKTPQQSQDIVEILREVLSKIELLTKRVERIEENQRERDTTLTDDVFNLKLDEALNHATPHRAQSPLFNPTIVSEMPMHVKHPAASASPSSSYHHLLAPSTPQHQQALQYSRAYLQAKEEPLPSASQKVFTQDVPTPDEAASRLAADKAGPPFFVVFNGQVPGVFTSWPFVMRTCKWQNGDWKRYETKATALQAYEDAYRQGGLKVKN